MGEKCRHIGCIKTEKILMAEMNVCERMVICFVLVVMDFSAKVIDGGRAQFAVRLICCRYAKFFLIL